MIFMTSSLFIRPRRLAFRALTALFVAASIAALRADDANDTPRQILICSSSQASPDLQKLVDDFSAQAANVPVLAALVAGKEAVGITKSSSEDLLVPKAYNTAAHNHLIVIGLRSQDPLLDKTWGFGAGVDEASKSFYATGYGYMSGDVGWVESDRNPFLHSRRIKSAPQDTLLFKISGTSEAGVAAALHAFEGGMLNGFVTAGPLTRPKTTLLDLDPSAEPAPGTLPVRLQIGQDTAALIGWTQPSEEEYRAVLEAGDTEPVKMWRYKYLVPGILEKSPIERWLGSVNRMAYGNAIDIIQCHSSDEAASAAAAMSKLSQKNANSSAVFAPVSLPGGQAAWQSPQIQDEIVSPSIWNIIVTSTGPYLILSSLPPEGTSAVMAALASSAQK